MSTRRGYEDIKRDINQNAKDVLGINMSTMGLARSQVLALYMVAEVLLDIREHLDGIEAKE